GLTHAVAQVVELGAPHITEGHRLDPGDDRRVHGEGALDSDPEADLADSERLAHTGTLTADDRALEHLDALPIALDDADMDLEGVSGSEVRDVVAEAAAVYEIGGVHGAAVSSTLPGGPTEYPCSASSRTSSSARPPRASTRSGRSRTVRRRAWARRQAAMR